MNPRYSYPISSEDSNNHHSPLLYHVLKNILIVDDEPNIRILLEQALEDLEDEGVELLTAQNGLEALTLIQEEQPNLVFLDVMMPKKKWD